MSRSSIVIIIYIIGLIFGALVLDMWSAETSPKALLGYGITNFLLWKKIGVNIFSFFKEVWLKVLPVIGVASLLYLSLKNYFLITNWAELIINVLVTSVFYMMCIWFLYLTKEEKSYFIKNK